jgi:glycosyltransferase involved in cell wall biosynthesis
MMTDTRRANLKPLSSSPRVTVITVCKDRAWCIANCVDSVLAQDYPDIEYIVQDGASRDDTVAVLRKYGNRVHLSSEPDRGPIDAFHKALAKATGDIFCMLLSDERFYDEQVVTRAVDAFRRYPEAGAVYGDFRTVDVHYQPIRVEKKRQVTFEEIFCYDSFITPCAAFVRLDALRTDGRLNSDLRSFFDDIGDFGLWVYVGSRHPLKYVPGIMADFMVHSGAISYGLKHCQAYIRECETAIEAFQCEAYPPPALARLKQRARARLYLNYSNILAEQHPSEAIRLAWDGIRRRPRLMLTRTFFAVLLRSMRLASLLPARRHGA